MVWGYFSDTSMGPLKRIVGTMNRYVYEDILKNTMQPWARTNLGRSSVFQQDNDPKHTSGHVAQLVSTSPCGSPEMTKSVSGLESHRTYVEELERRLNRVRAFNANQKFAQLEAA
uniref:Transposase n=1 Tax=Caenorhabditis japonica TaxID=281687 RepID=A0A8R1IAP6_CAEJA